MDKIEEAKKIKFGDILTFTREWYNASGKKEPNIPVKLIATGRVTGKEPDCIISVIKEKTSYAQQYHHTFLCLLFEPKLTVRQILELLDTHISRYLDGYGVRKGYGTSYKALSEFRQELEKREGAEPASVPATRKGTMRRETAIDE